MLPYIRIPNVSLPRSYDSSAGGTPADWQSESDAIEALGREGVRWVLYIPASAPPTNLSPGRVVPYSVAPPAAFDPGPDVAFVPQPVPRNIVWVGSNHLPPATDWQGLIEELGRTAYTHVIFCFLHFRVGDGKHDSGDNTLNLVINGPFPVGSYDVFWEAILQLRTGPVPKRVMVSIGGWGSGTWQAIHGREEEAAQILAQFVTESGFDGLDVNFEGPDGSSVESPFPGTDPGMIRRHDARWLESVAKFVVGLRDLLGGLDLTIAPICDNVLGTVGQLDAINRVGAASGRTWKDIVTWVNVQFYLYPYLQNLDEWYYKLVNPTGIPSDRIALGFPLYAEGGAALDNGQRSALGLPTYNDQGEPPALTAEEMAVLEKANQQATTSAAEFLSSHQNYQAPFGAFVWNYRSTEHPAGLGWDTTIGAALMAKPSVTVVLPIAQPDT